mgnify:CR=1 FL=1
MSTPYKSILRKTIATVCTIFIILGMIHHQAMASPTRFSRHKQLAHANNAFGLALYKELLKNKKYKNKNLFFSPHSLHIALSMTLEGARGRTEQEMNQVLRFSAGKQSLQKSISSFLSTLKIQGNRKHGKFRSVNRLWAQKGKRFLKSFLDNVKQNYGSGLRKLDFKTPASIKKAVKRINAWVARKTNNKIKELIHKSLVTPATRLILTNAVYFKDNWKVKFNKRHTRKRAFYTNDNQRVKVPTMFVKAKFKYGVQRGVQILELPYSSGFSMVVLLPRRKKLAQLEARLSAETLKKWLSRLYKRKTLVYLPRFKVKSGMLLKKTLIKMGMVAAFVKKAADFSGMDGTKWLKLAQVIHKGFVEVNEKGTEAAAATAVIVRMKRSARRPRPPVFRANRPFIYLIRDKHTGTILFMGRMMNPKAK